MGSVVAAPLGRGWIWVCLSIKGLTYVDFYLFSCYKLISVYQFFSGLHQRCNAAFSELAIHPPAPTGAGIGSRALALAGYAHYPQVLSTKCVDNWIQCKIFILGV